MPCVPSIPAVSRALIVPPPLRPGDLVALIAPSSPFDKALALRGAGWLAERYRVRFRPSVFERSGYLAGSDDRRLEEIDWALRSGARAVVAMRGGYGLSRIVDRIDWTPLEQQPCWIVGFSDITVLHVEAARRGIASIHGPMVCSLGRADFQLRSKWIRCLESPTSRRYWNGLEAWGEGTASGPLFGGNLAMLHSCAARGSLVVPPGAVLLIEDVGERPYRVDRMLSDLIAGGHLSCVSAVIVGDFSDCTPGRDGRNVRTVIRDRLCGVRVPVVAGMPIGHQLRNDPVTLGLQSIVDATAGVCIVGSNNET